MNKKSAQRQRIDESLSHIKKNYPGNFSPDTAVIISNKINLPKEFKSHCELSFEDIPPFNNDKAFSGKGKFACGKFADKDVIIFTGRFNYYDGISMRDIGHLIYVLKFLGVKKILSIDEAASLHPRYAAGELALVYDHINLTGDNPLIGENDEALGVRFPDMSNAYDREQYSHLFNILQKNMIKINESVCISTLGPGGETDAEVRFYRDIGADIISYNFAAENIAAVHAGIKFSAIGLLTRELIADRMLEDERTDEEHYQFNQKALSESQKLLKSVLKDIILAI